LFSASLKLPLSFDLVRLQQALASIDAAHWISHFNTSAYENGWRAIALRSVGGQLHDILPLDHADFADTPLLSACPYIQQVIQQFQCEKTSIRLMALDPGGWIKPHRDSGTALEDGITRLHIPIQTSPEVMFCIDGEHIHFSAGDTWYLNASWEHSVKNQSTKSRIHLMMDCITNPCLEQLFAQAGGVTRAPHAYPDPSIHDDNVQEVIAALRSGGHAASLQLAHQLQTIYAGRQNSPTRP
jgi:quercetin dioxygenase-like cupin family protein